MGKGLWVKEKDFKLQFSFWMEETNMASQTPLEFKYSLGLEMVEKGFPEMEPINPCENLHHFLNSVWSE